MIQLYGMASPNVLKVILMLEEVGLAYQLHHVNMIAGDQYGAEFRSLNPNGKVPVIVDPDGPDGKPFILFESGAILMYLADKTGMLWPSEPRAHTTVSQWLVFQMAGMGPMFGQFVHFRRAAPPGNDYALSRYGTEARRLFGVVEARLGDAAYLGGAEYSIADIATWPWARYHKIVGIEMARHPNLDRWLKAIESRPAAARTIAAEEEVKPLDSRIFRAADPDQMDRFLGRGRYARA